MHPEMSPTVVSETSSSLPLQPPPEGQPQQIPRFRRYLRATIAWVRGPDPPVNVSFKPIFPVLQEYPSETFRSAFKQYWHKLFALALYLFIWLLLFVAVIHHSRFASLVEGEEPHFLSCTLNHWSKDNGCGMNGERCRPFENDTLQFRCPAKCIQSGKLLNPYAIGDQIANYQPLVVGGPANSSTSDYGIYRSDSFICAAAIHAGVISNRYGGCGVASLVGANNNYISTKRHGIESLGFDATFPSSYTFLRDVQSSSCQDLRWHLFAVSIPFTTIISVVSSNAAIPYFSTFVGVFFHVVLASDAPGSKGKYGIISTALSRFLPAIFIAHFFWVYILSGVHSRAPKVERTILYLGGLWVGALTNLTFDAIIPISRLTARDLNQQPGAKTALGIIVVILFFVIIFQVWHLRQSGQLPKMLGLYATIGTSLGLLAAIPGTALRIHHYILSIILLPGTRILTRPSLIYQGVLVGLFINGTARWGFAGIVETYSSLRGDGLYFSEVPKLNTPEVTNENITIGWNATAMPDGVSLLVNDVEMYRGQAEEVGISRVPGEPLYLRIAYLQMTENGGLNTYDFSHAGTVMANGTWIPPSE
ncbi:hypothetical protein BZA77DRAFT_323490 [Pyronema omphalodes]|nr:hypothetical protein BZA77DRAFT_323490 [Pyronema omphalodes]